MHRNGMPGKLGKVLCLPFEMVNKRAGQGRGIFWECSLDGAVKQCRLA